MGYGMRILFLAALLFVSACDTMPNGRGKTVKGEWLCWEKGYGYVCYPSSLTAPDGNTWDVVRARQGCKANVERRGDG